MVRRLRGLWVSGPKAEASHCALIGRARRSDRFYAGGKKEDSPQRARKALSAVNPLFTLQVGPGSRSLVVRPRGPAAARPGAGQVFVLVAGAGLAGALAARAGQVLVLVGLLAALAGPRARQVVVARLLAAVAALAGRHRLQDLLDLADVDAAAHQPDDVVRVL